jgi:ankyrin repeat protein
MTISKLIVACQYGQHKIAEYFLKNDCVDVNAVNEKGNSALLFAALEGLSSVVHDLVARGAVIHCEPSKVYNKSLDCSSIYTPLIAAVTNNHIDIVHTLITSSGKFDINTSYCFDIAIGRNLMLKDFTLVSVASAFGRAEIVDLLAKYGADCCNIDINGCSLLHYAAAVTSSGYKVVEVLRTHGVFERISGFKNNKGNTSLHIACENKNVEFAKSLLEGSSSDINVRNSEGSTALHMSIKKKCESLVTLLLSHGADPNIEDGRGLSSEAVALKLKSEAISKILQQRSKSSSVNDGRIDIEEVV